MKTIPFTIDGSEIPADAPRSQGMDDELADLVATKAEEYRSQVLHCHFDLNGREITLYAANAPDGPVAFSFGDGSNDITEDSFEAQAQATHTYANDGVFTVQVAVRGDRWFTDAAVNWPAPPEEVLP